ncbi:hypothetical protein ACH5RR_040626 [Cinchona calisaya]|uniref:Uncharacterized protein n=1 Tax=Cinchona calisaya TaxID=153742 RepID=A0ABD2XS52_9GENT
MAAAASTADEIELKLSSEEEEHSEEQPDMKKQKLEEEEHGDNDWTDEEEDFSEMLRRRGITLKENRKTIEEEDEEDYLLGRTEEEANEIWGKYKKQIQESEGFDVDVFPGSSPYAIYVPYHYFKEDPKFYNELKVMAREALKFYHDQHDESYELEDVEKVVGTTSRLYFITFKAKDADGAAKIFQAIAFNEFIKYTIQLCRIKPIDKLVQDKESLEKQ